MVQCCQKKVPLPSSCRWLVPLVGYWPTLKAVSALDVPYTAPRTTVAGRRETVQNDDIPDLCRGGLYNRFVVRTKLDLSISKRGARSRS